MAAAYAALVSLTHILDKIQHPHPVHQIIIAMRHDRIVWLREKVMHLINFLENYSSKGYKEVEDLEKRIAEAAHEAEDIIESDVVNQIRARSSNLGAKSYDLSSQVIIEKFADIEIEVFKVEHNKRIGYTLFEISTKVSSSTPFVGKNTMVGFDDHKEKILDSLTTHESNRKIIPIVGMGGIGKTTLATNVYDSPLIVEHFYIRAWVTISQQYTMRELLLSLLNQINNTNGNEREMNEEILGDKLHKELFGRKYLVVMDDMWDIKAWEMVNRFLPDNSNGSRILVTTRQLNLAVNFGSCSPYELSFLDEAQSWHLLHKKIFAEEGCPFELEVIGRSIAKKSRGLPLALVVIGGLLAKSRRTREHWKYVEEDVTSVVNNQNDEFCIKILSLSYNHLPIYLKPCFLYLAVFPEDFEIRVSRLIRFWVAEGFIKQNRPKKLEKIAEEPKSLEKTAEEYLEDLIHRNLLVIGKRRISGEVKTLRIHDLLRDLCMREAHKDNFLGIAKLDNNPNTSPYVRSVRRLGIHRGTWKEMIFDGFRSARTRSFINHSSGNSSSYGGGEFELLRVLDVVDSYRADKILHLINLRYVACMGEKLKLSSISLLWSLQTLVIDADLNLPSEVWQMPQLRHIKARRISLPDPPDTQKIIVVENLQTLKTVKGFRCTEQVIERIPNVKKLGINCNATGENGSFCLSNIGLFHKLESLVLALKGTWENMVFPGSLKKLLLKGCKIPWENMSIVGSLPNLEVLKLWRHATIGQKWTPNAAEFVRLKLLLIDQCELEIWEADDAHFPCLEQLHLGHVNLKEIPAAFAEIISLQVIDLKYCSISLLESAKEISEQRQDEGYEALHVRSFPWISSLGEDNVVGFEDEADTLIEDLYEQPSSREREDNIVGFRDEADILIKYLKEQKEELDIISIIGMPGIGKTTLAMKIYRDSRDEFQTLIWVYVSKNFNKRDVFLTILKHFTPHDMSCKTENELILQVQSFLAESKFLLVLDDVWSTEDWDTIKDALPIRNRWGKVLITSHNNVNRRANSRDIRLNFLYPGESWELLKLQVFHNNIEEDCPSDLETIGKDIAVKCGGVPLAIVVVGRILREKLSAKGSVMTSEWEKVSDSLSTYLYPIDDQEKRMEKIIAWSCNQLSHDLKTCFLYLGMFPQNTEIQTWKLFQLWIAEGFIQPKPEKSMEEVAKDNLRDLTERNLVMVDKTNEEGDVKTCRVRGMIHEFCKTEAAKENLYQEMKRSREGVFDPSVCDVKQHHQHRIHFMDILREKPKGLSAVVCSFLCFSKKALPLSPENIPSIPDACNFLLSPENIPSIPDACNFLLSPENIPSIPLRALDVNLINFPKFLNKLTQLIHLRYIALSGDEFKALPEEVSKLWNLQTIRIDTLSRTYEIRANIWKMRQLRHLKTKAAIILNTEVEGEDECGENLQTLSRLSTQCCTEDVFNRASNLKNLGIRGQLATLLDSNCLEKLDHLQKLKLVYDVFPNSESRNPLCGLPNRFPPNVKILVLSATYLQWEHMSTLRMLRALEVLKLKGNAFVGKYWDAVRDGFPSLECLLISGTDLEFWTVSGDQFPRLRRLVLRGCKNLKEIPFELGESLQILDVGRVSVKAVHSAIKIRHRKEPMEILQTAKGDGFKLIIQ